jgi:hypothetical protein
MQIHFVKLLQKEKLQNHSVLESGGIFQYEPSGSGDNRSGQSSRAAGDPAAGVAAAAA